MGPQIQAELGEGHVNIIESKEVILTDHHLCLVMEYAAGNSLTGESGVVFSHFRSEFKSLVRRLWDRCSRAGKCGLPR